MMFNEKMKRTVFFAEVTNGIAIGGQVNAKR